MRQFGVLYDWRKEGWGEDGVPASCVLFGGGGGMAGLPCQECLAATSSTWWCGAAGGGSSYEHRNGDPAYVAIPILMRPHKQLLRMMCERRKRGSAFLQAV